MTKGKICLSSLHFCRRACFLFSNLMSERVAVIRFSGYPRSIRLALKCEILVWNSFSEDFVRRSLNASPLMKGRGGGGTLGISGWGCAAVTLEPLAYTRASFSWILPPYTSWLVRSTPDRVVRVRGLAGDIVLCSWARHFTLTVPLSTQVYKWVPA